MTIASSTLDASLMRRAIDLATRGRGSVEPNPMVGCAIVNAGRIIGEGWHAKFGGPHAEPTALAACAAANEPTEGATAYVNLEPCCHTNKQTPPCVPALLAAGIRRVVVGCEDPNPDVVGKGLAQLRAAGVEVMAGVLEAECRQLNAAFFARINETRPYVTLKWAETADGKVAGAGGKRVYISNPTSFTLLHHLRARSDAILVGIRTVLTDDPLLTARGPENPRPLLRIVVDTHLRLPDSSQLAQTARRSPVIVYCAKETYESHYALVAALQHHAVQVIPLPTDGSNVSLPALLQDLGTRQVTHLLVESGPTLAKSFLSQGLADRLWVFRSPMTIGDATAPAAERAPYPAVAQADLDGDILTEYLNPGSPVYFAPEKSVDFTQLTAG